MFRRTFLKLTAAALLHPALNWQQGSKLIPLEEAIYIMHCHLVKHILLVPPSLKRECVRIKLDSYCGRDIVELGYIFNA